MGRRVRTTVAHQRFLLWRNCAVLGHDGFWMTLPRWRIRSTKWMDRPQQSRSWRDLFYWQRIGGGNRERPWTCFLVRRKNSHSRHPRNHMSRSMRIRTRS